MHNIDQNQLAEAKRILAQNQPIPTVYADRLEEVGAAVHHEPSLVAIDQLIQDARAKLGANPTADTDDAPHSSVEASDPAMLNALSAERAALYRQKKEIETRIAAIDDIAKALLGDIDDLKANGVTVVTYRPTQSRVLNQAHVKKLFPDTADNAELWTTQTTRRINWVG